jgi:hypothetical protein
MRPPAIREAVFLFAASPPGNGRRSIMWSEWLAKTLNPRRTAGDAATPRAHRRVFTVLPDLECDGMHPGADEFRSAVTTVEVDAAR